MSKEFANEAVQAEYDNLRMEEDFLLGELEPIQRRISEIEDTEEQL